VAQPDLIETLRWIGIDSTDLGVEITTRKILDSSGLLASESTCPQVLTAWERVYRVLRDAFSPRHYHRGRGVRSFEQTANSVVAHFGDHGVIESDLLVGADGLRSTIRRQCLPELAPLYAGYVAWRALIPETAFPPAIHRELFNYMTFCLPPGEQFLGYPVAGPDNDLRPGHRRYNIVWYRPADETGELQHLLTDEGGTTHAVSIPPPLIRHDAIAAMRAAAERLLAPQFRAVVRMIDEPMLQPIYDLETPRMAFGRVAIIGDAAFVARPHVAAGVAKAADDAAALAAALDVGEVEPALLRFEAARLPIGRRIIERARHLGAYLQATQTVEERARSRRHGIPEAVLAETAVLDFLRT
jgi:2-polyprenyl-6-methoxyphenol hydroxylase-like FAD-dependent oxidoreductase